MHIIALTGGIGSGKSTVSKLFADLGVDIIDTDLIARDLVKPGSSALMQIQEHFGQSIVDKEGELKRTTLRKKIFANPADKAWLEELLHPLIREEVRHRVSVSKAPYCMVVIPLFFETTSAMPCDRVLVVDAPDAMRITRVMQRDNTSKADVEAIMQSQVSNKTRREGADDIIENNGSLEELKKQVRALHKKYLAL